MRKLSSKALTLLILIFVIGINILSVYFFVRFDLTRDQQYSLSASTKNFLSNLEEAITVKAFFTADLPPQFISARQYVQDILGEYQIFGGRRFSYAFIDPAKDSKTEEDAMKIGIQPVNMQVREQDSLQVKKGYLGIGIFYKDKTEAIPVLQQQDLSNLEYALTSLMVKITKSKLPVVAFLKGHGEHEIGYGLQMIGLPAAKEENYSLLGQVLRKNYEVKTIDFALGNTLTGVDLLIVAGPKRNLPDRDIFEIDQFLLGGGKAIFLIDAVAQTTETSIDHQALDVNIKTLFEPFGITVPSKILFDRNADFGRFSEGPGQFFIVPYPPFIRFAQENFSKNPIVSKIKSLVMRFVSPLEITKKEEIDIDPFIVTSKASWTIEPPFSLNPTSVSQPSADQMKSFPVAIMVSGLFPRISKAKGIPLLEEWKEDQRKGFVLSPVSSDPTRKNRKIIEKPNRPTKIIIVSDSDFVRDEIVSDDETSLAVFLNMVDSLALGDELIAIRSKALGGAPLPPLENADKMMIKFVGILLVPLLISFYGIGRLWLRRKSSSRL